MATATLLSLSPSHPSLSSIFNPKPNCFRTSSSSSLPSIRSPVPLLVTLSSRRIAIHHRNPSQTIPPTSARNWRTPAFPGGIFLSEIENSQQIVSTDNEGASYAVSTLLLFAFVALSVLTAGVIYIGVTDFLQKREKEKFEKEEAAKEKKMKGKKGVVKARARAGPRGFGQKIDGDNDVDDDDD